MKEIQDALAKNATADVSGLVKERGTKISSSPELTSQWGESQTELEQKYLTPEVPKVEEPKEPTISESLKTQSAANTTSLVSALKQRIADSKMAQEQVIAKAPQTYDPLRAQSEVAKSQQLRGALERSRNLGDRGGIGRSEALATQTAGESRLNAIDLQQQNVIDNANAEIARLESEGRFQEAEIVANQQSQLLQALTQERIRQEGIERENAMLAREEEIRQEGLTLDTQERERNQFMETAGQFAGDYQGQINSVLGDNDPSNDWKADILGALLQQQIQENEALKLKSGSGKAKKEVPTSEQEANYYAMWNNYLSPQSAWANDPQGMLASLSRDNTIRQQIGDVLYERLLSEAQAVAQGYQPPAPYTREEYLKDLQTESDIYALENPEAPKLSTDFTRYQGSIDRIYESYPLAKDAIEGEVTAEMELSAYVDNLYNTRQLDANQAKALGADLGFNWYAPEAGMQPGESLNRK